MKRLALILFVILLGVSMLNGCGKGKYDDVIEYNDQFVKITREYIDDLNKADTGKDVAKAMNEFADEFKKLVPKMKEINKKFPELQKMKDLPEELVESQRKAQEVGMDFASSFMKTMKYAIEPEVVEAQKRMGKIMASMGES